MNSSFFILIITTIILIFLFSVHTVNAVECGTPVNYNHSPCCWLSLANNTITWAFIRYVLTTPQCYLLSSISPGGCPICGTYNRSDIATAASTQKDLDMLLEFYNKNDCWNGDIGTMPDNAPVKLKPKNEFLYEAACVMGCRVDPSIQCPSSPQDSGYVPPLIPLLPGMYIPMP